MKLETKRLILRQPKKSDWKDIVEGIGEYNVAKMMSRVPYPYKKKDAISFINKKINGLKQKNKDYYLFFIELKSEKKVIGAIELSKINYFSQTAVTGSWINKKYWRQGYITEAKIALNNFAFNKLKLQRLNSIVHTDNIASNKTQMKVGYKLEGTMRKYVRSKASGKIHDVNFYGLLKEDWQKAKHKLVK